MPAQRPPVAALGASPARLAQRATFAAAAESSSGTGGTGSSSILVRRGLYEPLQWSQWRPKQTICSRMECEPIAPFASYVGVKKPAFACSPTRMHVSTRDCCSCALKAFRSRTHPGCRMLAVRLGGLGLRHASW